MLVHHQYFKDRSWKSKHSVNQLLVFTVFFIHVFFVTKVDAFPLLHLLLLLKEFVYFNLHFILDSWNLFGLLCVVGGPIGWCKHGRYPWLTELEFLDISLGIFFGFLHSYNYLFWAKFVLQMVSFLKDSFFTCKSLSHSVSTRVCKFSLILTILLHVDINILECQNFR
jgi:hypothetical protein